MSHPERETYSGDPAEHSHTATWEHADEPVHCADCGDKARDYLFIEPQSRLGPARIVCEACAFMSLTDDGRMRYPFPAVMDEIMAARHLWHGVLHFTNKRIGQLADRLNNWNRES